MASAVLVAVAEIGDKTQLLSFVLAARLRQPIPIILGILAATVANHALAAWLGVFAAARLPPLLLPWIIGLMFIGFGLWALHPDSLDDEPTPYRAGAFVTALIAFFLAEMGDKTQFATIALAARYDAIIAVVSGTTVGMMVANVPAVLVGEALTRKVPMKPMRWIAAAVFVITGIAAIAGAPNPVR